MIARISAFVNAVTALSRRPHILPCDRRRIRARAICATVRRGSAAWVLRVREQLKLLVEATTARGQKPVTSHPRPSRLAAADVASDMDAWWRNDLVDHNAAAMHPKAVARCGVAAGAARCGTRPHSISEPRERLDAGRAAGRSGRRARYPAGRACVELDGTVPGRPRD